MWSFTHRGRHAAEQRAADRHADGSRRGATFTAPATITLTASASDSDGTIAKVDFYRRRDAARHGHDGAVRVHVEQRRHRQLQPDGGGDRRSARRRRRPAPSRSLSAASAADRPSERMDQCRHRRDRRRRQHHVRERHLHRHRRRRGCLGHGRRAPLRLQHARRRRDDRRARHLDPERPRLDEGGRDDPQLPVAVRGAGVHARRLVRGEGRAVPAPPADGDISVSIAGQPVDRAALGQAGARRQSDHRL